MIEKNICSGVKKNCLSKIRVEKKFDHEEKHDPPISWSAPYSLVTEGHQPSIKMV